MALSCSWSRAFAAQADPLPSQPGSDEAEVQVSGKILGGDSSLGRWTVALRPLSRGQEQKTAPRKNGSFQFHGVTSGEYELRVSDARGSVLHEETVSLRRGEQMLSITVPPVEPARGLKRDVVSVHQLQHRTPRQALIEYQKGADALKKRELTAAVDHLKAAADLDPGFVNAHAQLGVAYAGSDQFQKGVDEFQKALDLDPLHPQANNNLCILLLSLKRYSEAGQVADRLLRRGMGSAVAHYVAAISLLVENSARGDALFHLHNAADVMPRIRLLGARILADEGHRTEAANELEAYLRSRDEYNRPEVETWLAELRQ